MNVGRTRWCDVVGNGDRANDFSGYLLLVRRLDDRIERLVLRACFKQIRIERIANRLPKAGTRHAHLANRVRWIDLCVGYGIVRPLSNGAQQESRPPHAGKSAMAIVKVDRHSDEIDMLAFLLLVDLA